MVAILKPIGIGLLGFLASCLAFWFGFAFILLPLGASAINWYPIAVVALPLLVAGYLGARFTASRYASRRVLIGAITGALGLMFLLLLGQSEGVWWFMPLLVLGAFAWSAIGGLIGVATSRQPRHD